MPEKPKFEDYKAWLIESLSIDLDDPRYKLFYELNATRVLTTAQQHRFFLDAERFLSDVSAEYDAAGPYGLLMGRNEIQLVTKPFDSVINKSYRKNIAFNNRFPKEPLDGWCTPSQWFTAFDDIVRGTIVTKYIDAPEFLSSKLTEFADTLSLVSSVSSRESDSGYYAYHFYLSIPVEIAQVDMQPSQIDMKVELQITTQLQEILRKLTHGFYEELRLDPKQDRRAWKWDFQSPRFQASYLGHTLHLLEGVIVQLKNRNVSGHPKTELEAKGEASGE